ncbi:Energy-coupling factor transporter ATP-binding protein EcfA1 [bioreactor metagenome]|uniref:Energy-coupling factor transporter ATP-binding protein EcfA1 n=1 Tax=bioreactor metagenome TaxID=1076179 RepID=A0A645BGD7_9ZZZZ
MTPNAQIEIVNVGFQYAGAEKIALKNISLSIHKGEVIAIVGHNGSGKSTLCKMLNALLIPAEGTVTVDGMDTRDEKNLLEIRRRVGMVFQNPDNQLVTTIVEEDVGFGPENLGVPPAEIRVRVDAALNEVEMSAYAEKASHALSGGQKQRVAIAGLLAMQPEVLVLDEATAMLDPRGREEVLSTVKKLNQERGMTVVMITQFMEEALGADRVFVLSEGRLVMEGTPREVFNERALLEESRLDAPAFVKLRDELLAAGLPISHEAMSCEALADELSRVLKA